MFRSLFSIFVCCVTVEAFADVQFHPDAGVLDVTRYGARGDDAVDDTAAIQALLDQHPSGNHIFYFPDGTYLLSETLRPALDDGVTKRNVFQGQSEQGTVLKLRDGVDLNDAVIDFRGGPAQFFRNAVRDLTIDIGEGNPNASGIKFNASNQGTIRNVTIRSDDGGVIGLDLGHSGEVGPLLIANVTIKGFDTGVSTRWQTASQTIDGLTLEGQRRVGWINQNAQTVFARRIVSRNTCPAIMNILEGRMLVVDSQLLGVGDASKTPAIRNQKSIYLRRVDTTGYAMGVTNQLVAGRGNPGRKAGLIEEYWANGAGDRRRGGPYQLFPSAETMLDLAFENAPELPWDDPRDWCSPRRFGGEPNDRNDDTEAIQAAVDSGAKTVFLPRGTWQVDGLVQLRGNVTRLIGTEAKIRGQGEFRILDGNSETMVVERLEGDARFNHASSRTLSLEHLLGFSYRSSIDRPGKLFLSDVVGRPFRIKADQRVWARQLDIEGRIEGDESIPARVHNDGGVFCVLGFKTEDEGTHIKTENGGRTEVLGALHVGDFGSEPRYITIDSEFSSAVVKGGRSTVLEIRRGEERRGEIGNADVYVASPE